MTTLPLGPTAVLSWCCLAYTGNPKGSLIAFLSPAQLCTSRLLQIGPVKIRRQHYHSCFYYININTIDSSRNNCVSGFLFIPMYLFGSVLLSTSLLKKLKTNETSSEPPQTIFILHIDLHILLHTDCYYWMSLPSNKYNIILIINTSSGLKICFSEKKSKKETMKEKGSIKGK